MYTTCLTPRTAWYEVPILYEDGNYLTFNVLIGSDMICLILHTWIYSTIFIKMGTVHISCKQEALLPKSKSEVGLPMSK